MNQFVTLLITSLQNAMAPPRKKTLKGQKVLYFLHTTPQFFPEVQVEVGWQNMDTFKNPSEFDGPATKSEKLPLPISLRFFT